MECGDWSEVICLYECVDEVCCVDYDGIDVGVLEGVFCV